MGSGKCRGNVLGRLHCHQNVNKAKRLPQRVRIDCKSLLISRRIMIIGSSREPIACESPRGLVLGVREGRFSDGYWAADGAAADG